MGYLLAPIVLHGLYNWCSTLQRCEAYEEEYQGKLYKSDGCYLPPHWRMVFRGGHTVVMLLSFYWWHCEFSDIAGPEDEDLDDAEAPPRPTTFDTTMAADTLQARGSSQQHLIAVARGHQS